MTRQPLFGPGGNSKSFYDAGYKSTLDAPAFVASFGLDAYEYEAGNGLAAGDAALSAIGDAAEHAGIAMSLHAPYFISLTTPEPEKREKSIGYVKASLHAARLLGARTVVVHMGGVAKMSREEGMRNSAEALYRLFESIDEPGTVIGLETMGKINQLGTLSEVLTLCTMDKHLAPVVDFGHLNARALGGDGGFHSKDDYMRVFDEIACTLGDYAACHLHAHFSKIEYTGAGEKRHLTFEDAEYGPAFEPLMEAIYTLGVTPTIICESAGTMAEDALRMKRYYCALEGRP